ncbi:hypothetical protein C6Q14_18605 [Burkholderia ambifaria]|nr:hypothetical protein C6Q14_18605 [Burkholderia ambifaria]
MGNRGQESGGGPDAGSRHTGQGRPKTVSKYQPFYFDSELIGLLTHGSSCWVKVRRDDSRGRCVGDDSGLFAQWLNDRRRLRRVNGMGHVAKPAGW